MLIGMAVVEVLCVLFVVLFCLHFFVRDIAVITLRERQKEGERQRDTSRW